MSTKTLISGSGERPSEAVNPRWLARRRWARVGWAYATLLLLSTFILGIFYASFGASVKNDPLEWPFRFDPPQLRVSNWVAAARLGAAGGGNALLGGFSEGRSLDFEVTYFVPEGVTLELDPLIPARRASARLVSPPARELAADHSDVKVQEIGREPEELNEKQGEAITYQLSVDYEDAGPRVLEVPLDLSLEREAFRAGVRVMDATLPPDRIERRGLVASWDNLSPGVLGYVFRNYVRVFRNTTDRNGDSLFTRWIINSFVYATARVLAALIFASMAGYALARMRFPGREALFLLVLFSQMVPAQVTFISNYLVLRDGIFGLSKLFGMDTLLNTLPGLIVGGSGATALVAASSVFIMKQFFESIPPSIEEAARIDGANPLQVFFRIVFPLATPALGALTILTFQSNWNDFFWPLVTMTSREAYTLPIGLLTFREAYGAAGDWGLILAGAFLSMIPILILFIVFQRYFVEGASFSGLKG